MADFILRLQYRDGTYIGEPPFFDLQGEFRMNEPDEIRFSLSSIDLINYVDPVSQLKEGLTEAILLRDGVPIFTGPIWNITCTSNDKVLKCVAQDISSYLARRNIIAATKFTKKRFAYGAWKLIQNTQALSYGNLGITLGQDALTNPTGTWSYAGKSGKTVLNAISDLANGTNGFDWEINPDRQLMMYYPRIQTPSLLKLEYGGNIKNYSVQGMGSYVANEVFGRGGNKVVSSTYSDMPSKAFYGLRQYAFSNSNVKSKSKLDGMARSQLNLRKNPRLIPQLTVDSEMVNPFEGDIWFGYLVNTVIDDGWVQFNGTMRCSGFQLTIGKHGDETFVLYINDTREIEDTAV